MYPGAPFKPPGAPPTPGGVRATMPPPPGVIPKPRATMPAPAQGIPDLDGQLASMSDPFWRRRRFTRDDSFPELREMAFTSQATAPPPPPLAQRSNPAQQNKYQNNNSGSVQPSSKSFSGKQIPHFTPDTRQVPLNFHPPRPESRSQKPAYNQQAYQQQQQYQQQPQQMAFAFNTPNQQAQPAPPQYQQKQMAFAFSSPNQQQQQPQGFHQQPQQQWNQQYQNQYNPPRKESKQSSSRIKRRKNRNNRNAPMSASKPTGENNFGGLPPPQGSKNQSFDAPSRQPNSNRYEDYQGQQRYPTPSQSNSERAYALPGLAQGSRNQQVRSPPSGRRPMESSRSRSRSRSRLRRGSENPSQSNTDTNVLMSQAYAERRNQVSRKSRQNQYSESQPPPVPPKVPSRNYRGYKPPGYGP